MAIFSTIASWRAGKHYERNTTHSLLYALPYELVKRIGSHLDHVDRVCFTLSSIKYLEVIQPLHPRTVPDPQHRRAIQRRLWRDDFYRWRRFNVVVCVTWCVGCTDEHPNHLFPRNTSELERKDRWCRKAIKGLLVICKHHQFHFKDMVKLATKEKEKRTFGLRHDGFWFWNCGECERERSEGHHVLQAAIRFLDPPKLSFEHYISVWQLNYTLRLFAVSRYPNRPTLTSQIVKAMRTAALRICPHMATDDEATLKRLVTKVPAVHDYALATGISLSCGVCRTDFSVKKRSGLGFWDSEVVVMEVERNLGKLEKESDPVWRKHLQGRYVVDG